MALARVKVWTPEILTATDLNTEFNNILNYLNGTAITLTSPTLVGPIITNPTINGTVTGTIAFVGPVTVAGAFTANGQSLIAAQATASFQVAGVASATYTTLFSALGLHGAFLVFVNTNNSDSQTGAAIYASNGSSLTLLWQSNTGNITFRASGTNVQAQQTNGVGQVLTGLYSNFSVSGVW